MKFIKKAAVAVILCAAAVNMYGNYSDLIYQTVGGAFSLAATVFEELYPDTVAPKRGKNAPTEETSETVSTAVETFSTNPCGWYCMHKKNGERPPLPGEMSYIGNYGGYYLGDDEKVIYLTFDAGYENGNIEKILDTLKAEEVPAAFFILENLVESNTELVMRMADEGHLVCNHTAKHKDMTKMATESDFAAELARMENVYTEITGRKLAHYFRPPEGKISEQSLAWADSLGYKTILWSYAYADWDNAKQPDPSVAVEKIISGTHNGEVLLLHPTSSTNAEILPELIHRWKEMGYRFGTLDELTGSDKG